MSCSGGGTKWQDNPEMHPLDSFYETHPEPVRSTLLAMRQLIHKTVPEVEEAWKYGMPFFLFRGRMWVYLWVDKKRGWPYVGLVDGALISFPDLEREERSRMAVFRINPSKDLPVRKFSSLLKTALSIRK